MVNPKLRVFSGVVGCGLKVQVVTPFASRSLSLVLLFRETVQSPARSAETFWSATLMASSLSDAAAAGATSPESGESGTTTAPAMATVNADRTAIPERAR